MTNSHANGHLTPTSYSSLVISWWQIFTLSSTYILSIWHMSHTWTRLQLIPPQLVPLHRLHRKHHFQLCLFCCIHIHCCRNVFTEPFPGSIYLFLLIKISCLVGNVVSLFVLRSLPRNKSIHQSILFLTTQLQTKIKLSLHIRQCVIEYTTPLPLLKILMQLNPFKTKIFLCIGTCHWSEFSLLALYSRNWQAEHIAWVWRNMLTLA
jgi:hypothetical protein